MLMQRWLLLLLCVLVLLTSEAQAALGHQQQRLTAAQSAMSGCELCQSTALCRHAFHGSPGRFCHTLVSGLPCCCSQDSQCIADALSCRCRTIVESPGDGAGDRRPPSSWTALPAGVVLLLLFCWKCFCTRESAQTPRKRQTVSSYGGRYYQYESTNAPSPQRVVKAVSSRGGWFNRYYQQIHDDYYTKAQSIPMVQPPRTVL